MKSKITKYVLIIAMLASVFLMYSCQDILASIRYEREKYSQRAYETDGTLDIDSVRERFSPWIESDEYRNITPAKSPFPVRTAQELMAIGANKSSLKGIYYLANDIDISGIENWDPIGDNEDFPFTGVLHGNGKIIYGLKIDRDKDANEQGLFGRTYGAFIHDLGVGVVSIKAGSAVGAVVGSADFISRIVNVAVAPVTDTARVQGSGGYYWRGGLFLGERPGGEIFSVAGKKIPHALVGGIAGHAHLQSYVKGYNLGLEVAFVAPFEHNLYVHFAGFIGGLVGSNYGTVEGASTANVKSTETTAGFVGGLVGYNFGKVTGIATGDVSTDFAPYVGGLVGSNVGIVLGVATGDVSSKFAGPAHVGGFVGHNNGQATGVSTGNVLVEDALSEVGGFFGSGGSSVNATSGYFAVGYTLSNIVFKGAKDTNSKLIGPAVGSADDISSADSVYYFYQNDKFEKLVNLGDNVSYENPYGVAVQTYLDVPYYATITDKAPELREGSHEGEWKIQDGAWPVPNLPSSVTSVVDVEIKAPAKPTGF